MKYIVDFFNELVSLFNEMSPYLLLGFLFAGILHIFFPKEKVKKYLGKDSLKSSIYAAILGIPMPLCSCGVIPTGISFYKDGASKGASVSFLISTPQTGIDSVLVTYSLLGGPFAIVRPIIAFVTGVFGGWLSSMGSREEEIIEKTDCSGETCCSTGCCSSGNDEKTEKGSKLHQMFRYAFVNFLNDISKWLVIGLLLAAVLALVVPDDFFASYVSNKFLGYFIILLASVPLYVCATASIPIAAVLMLKGLSPGAALVFLMAGPATNVATMTVLGNVLGKKALFNYLFSIIGGALFFAIIIDYAMPAEWFSLKGAMSHIHHEHEILPEWLKIASSITLIALIINGYVQSKRTSIMTKKQNTINKTIMNERKFKVSGMTCNHCKNNVETHILRIGGIESVEADISTQEVVIKGDNINDEDIKQKIEGLGYGFKGPV